MVTLSTCIQFMYLRRCVGKVLHVFSDILYALRSFESGVALRVGVTALKVF